MSDYVTVMAIVEGTTEELFVNTLLANYFASFNIGVKAVKVSKPGQKGGDVKFSRVKNDIRNFLRQQRNLYITTIIDYYGVKEWPGVNEITSSMSVADIERHLNDATIQELCKEFPDLEYDIRKRFIPFMMMHEMEALYFSNPEVLAACLKVDVADVRRIVAPYGNPEEINNSRDTAPSKRLDALYRKGQKAGRLSQNAEFPKTSLGRTIAENVGIDSMMRACPEFNKWIERIKALKPLD